MWHRMTVPLDGCGMSIHWSNDGYKGFFSMVSVYDHSWTEFPGNNVIFDVDLTLGRAAHHLPNETSDYRIKPAATNTRCDLVHRSSNPAILATNRRNK